jgi:mannose-6-phosphate isomerase
MQPFSVNRPWGGFRRFDPGEIVAVKIMRINPHASVSLQYHERRREFWHIISGDPTITIGDAVVAAKPGDEFTIDQKAVHRVASGNQETVFLEIWFGDADETDIVRIEDAYGRKGTKPDSETV